jgi:hypothetical protein
LLRRGVRVGVRLLRGVVELPNEVVPFVWKIPLAPLESDVGSLRLK